LIVERCEPVSRSNPVSEAKLATSEVPNADQACMRVVIELEPFAAGSSNAPQRTTCLKRQHASVRPYPVPRPHNAERAGSTGAQRIDEVGILLDDAVAEGNGDEALTIAVRGAERFELDTPSVSLCDRDRRARAALYTQQGGLIRVTPSTAECATL